MKFGVRKLVTVAAIGALYAALTLVLAPISYGVLQFRISEVLCILPFFFPESVAGLTVGCIIANLLGPSAGPLDIVFGSLASLLAGICTAEIGIHAGKYEKISWGACLSACFMPVLFNAPILGAVYAAASSEYGFWKGFLIYGGQIGIEELCVLFALGLPAMRYIIRNNVLRRILSGRN